jgi:hypothetical protein
MTAKLMTMGMPCNAATTISILLRKLPDINIITTFIQQRQKLYFRIWLSTYRMWAAASHQLPGITLLWGVESGISTVSLSRLAPRPPNPKSRVSSRQKKQRLGFCGRDSGRSVVAQLSAVDLRASASPVPHLFSIQVQTTRYVPSCLRPC